jgi:phage-related minor tail protein
VASGIEEAMNRAFKGAEDAVVEFVQTGKLSVSSFLKDIEEQLLRSAVRGLLADLGGQIGIGERPENNLLGSIFGGAQGGGAGFLGQLGGLFAGAQNGADFMVGSGTSPNMFAGADKRLVAFKAKDGERVTVTPQGQPSGGSVSVVFNVQTPDADSFRKSQGQMIGDLQNVLMKEGRRYT